MDNLVKSVPKNYKLYGLIIAMIGLFLAMTIFWVGKGTFSIDSTPQVTISCPSASSGETIDCSISLSIANSITVLSVNANYEFSSGVEYVSFTNNCSGDNCFETYASTANGFAVGNVDGISKTINIGTLKIKVSGANNKIVLKNIELCDEEYNMISLNDASKSISISSGGNDDPPESEYINISNDLIVENNIIKRLSLGTTYGDLKKKISTDGEITIISNNGKSVSDSDIIKTGDKLSIQLSSKMVTYDLSVLGDLTGDGQFKVNDVGKLYRNLKGKETFNEVNLAAGDIIDDEVIKINDVSRLYRYLKGRVTSLEVVK